MTHRQPRQCWVPKLERWVFLFKQINSHRNNGSFFILFMVKEDLLHHSRKTHNAHRETQRRFAKLKRTYRYKWRTNNIFYIENSKSKKYFKIICNRCFRKSKESNEVNNINKKVLSRIYDKLNVD